MATNYDLPPPPLDQADGSALPPPPMGDNSSQGAGAPSSGLEINLEPLSPYAGANPLQEYREAIKALTPAQRAAMLKAQNASHEQFMRDNPAPMSGPATALDAFSNMAFYGQQPYLAAGMSSDPNKTVQWMKNREKFSEEQHPYWHALGSGLGLVGGMLTGSTEQKLAKSLAQGAAYGLTQGGSGLEDWWNNKASAWKPAMQAVEGSLLAYPAHVIGQKISPDALKNAASYAYDLGVKLPAGILNAGQKGFEHLTSGAQQTANGVRQRLYEFAGDIDPTEAAQKAINDFLVYTGQHVPPHLSKAFDYLGNTLSNAPDTAMDAISKVGPDALRAMRSTLQKNGASSTWENLQNGFLRHLGDSHMPGTSGKLFHFGDFTNRLKNLRESGRKVLFEGYDDANHLLNSVGNLANSVGHDFVDAASHGITFAGKAPGKFKKFLQNSAPLGAYAALQNFPFGMSLAHAAAAAPIVSAGYVAHKGSQAAGKLLDRRNAAIAPAVSNAISRGRNAVVRGLTSAGSHLADYTQAPIQSLVHTVASPETEKWWLKNMPSYLGGRAAGGRIAYKKGGAVSPNIEALVQDLMGRYKAVKKAQDNKTKPLLEQPDEAIVKALSVAQKAI